MLNDFLRNLIILSNLLTVIFCLSLGIYSVRRRYGDIIIRLWFFLCLAVSVWCGSYIFLNFSDESGLAMFYIRLIYISISLIPVLFLHFVVRYLHRYSFDKKIIGLGYIISLIFIFLFTFTNLIISGTKYTYGFGRHESVNNFAYLFFLIYFFSCIAWAIILLYREYKNSVGVKKRQVYFLILASFFGFVGGSTNFMTNMWGVFPYGQMFVWLYPILITYGIFMDEIKFK